MMLPRKVGKSPVKEVILEVRFTSSFPEDAVFGILYKEIQKDYSTVEKLPILQLPEQIRSKDKNLKFQPHYRLKTDDFTLQIGPRAFSVVQTGVYFGWEQFSKQIYTNLEKFKTLNILEKIERVGLRYVNVFEKMAIYDNMKLNITIDEKDIGANKISLMTELISDEYTQVLNILNGAEALIEGKTVQGSVIDIDSFIIEPNNFLKDNRRDIETLHEAGKKLFFSLLKDNFIDTLTPEYEEI